MPNSDNTFGTFNKQTNIYSQTVHTHTDDWGVSTTPTKTTFSTVDEAKSFFFTADALTMFEECCTTQQWALVSNDALKTTFDFGTKGTADITEANDWAGQFVSRKQALSDANNFHSTAPSGIEITLASSTEHLF